MVQSRRGYTAHSSVARVTISPSGVKGVWENLAAVPYTVLHMMTPRVLYLHVTTVVV